MKRLLPLILISGLLLVNLLFNSCKKDNDGAVETLLARGTWQLASVQLFNYIGSTNTSTDILNDSCSTTQTFTFNPDNTCTYQNFSCITQTTKGSWKFTDDKLTLISNMKAQDTINKGKTIITTSPFINARIVNLGQYSLILETGDISSFFKATDVRHIKRYGFIRF